jgi:hypothetical protein
MNRRARMKLIRMTTAVSPETSRISFLNSLGGAS